MTDRVSALAALQTLTAVHARVYVGALTQPCVDGLSLLFSFAVIYTDLDSVPVGKYSELSVYPTTAWVTNRSWTLIVVHCVCSIFIGSHLVFA